MIALFVLKLCTGISLMWLLMPRRDVTDGFFRIQMRLVLGLAVLAALMLHTSESSELPQANIIPTIRSAMIGVAVIAYHGSILWALGRRVPGTTLIVSIAVACCYALWLHSGLHAGPASAVLHLLADFSTAAVVGSVLTGMLLGHWYLTTPTMSINPLWWFNKAIVAAAVLRCVASAWALTQYGLPSGDATQQIWLGIRWAGGIVAPALVALLVWRILKHRNTQSATGVLFAGLILVFMGEMTAALLERHSQIPY